MNGSTALEGVPGNVKGVGFGVSQAAESPRFQPNDGVLLREMR